MLNHIDIMGRLTRDPELRHTNSGTAVASFTLAVDRDFSGRDGGEKETDFINCVAWGHTADFVSKYFTKGRMAVVSGRLQVRKWQNNDGENRYSTEVIAENIYFGDSKKEASNGNSYGQQAATASPDPNSIPTGYEQGYTTSTGRHIPAEKMEMMEIDEELPF